MPFDVTPGRLEAKRTITERGGGEETFSGVISSDGRVQLSGKGSYKSGASWVYEFTGTRQKVKDTVLTGRLTQTVGLVGGRSCTLRFIKAAATI